jgi:hypothetical protein
LRGRNRKVIAVRKVIALPRLGRLGSLVAFLMLVGLCVAPADARQKKPGPGGVTCNCQCHSDQKNQSGLPVYYESVSFAETDNSSCWANSGFAGCRVKNGSGVYVSGTLRLCDPKTTAAAATGSAGVDSGQPQSPQPFSKPIQQFLQP